MRADRRGPEGLVLNAVEPQLRETEQAQAFIAKAGIALAPVYLSKAVAYHRAITAGLGVTEFEPAGKAAQEILSLLEWISRLIDLPTHITVEPLSQQRRSPIPALKNSSLPAPLRDPCRHRRTRRAAAASQAARRPS